MQSLLAADLAHAACAAQIDAHRPDRELDPKPYSPFDHIFSAGICCGCQIERLLRFTAVGASGGQSGPSGAVGEGRIGLRFAGE